MTARIGISSIQFVILWTLMLSLLTFGYFFGRPYFNTTNKIASPIVADSELTPDLDEAEFDGILENSVGFEEKDSLLKSKSPNDPSDKSKPFNLLVLGIDRRTGDQTNWRTDVIQLITISADRSKAVVTHIPRDVWAETYKINAVYNLQGPDAIKDIIEKITNQRPDRIIRVDFDAFVYAVDAVGGININVPTAFTDDFYPDDRNGSDDVISVKFDAGEQNMNGETALIYARSRKGSNGEGSDYARGKRQQIVMHTVIKDFFNPSNLFKPKSAKVLYEIATRNIYTDLTLSDTTVLFEILLNYKNIDVKNLGLDTTNFLVSPSDRSEYGGSWTLIAKDNDYTPIHQEIADHIN